MSSQRGRSSHYSRPPRSSSQYSSSRSYTSSVSSQNDSPYQMMDIEVSVDVMEGLVMEVKDKSIYQETYNDPDQSKKILGSLPVTAFISCKKNVSNTRSIATNVPSIPLSTSSSSHGGKHRHYLVRWPADYDPYGDALSTFKLSRLMKKASSTSSCGSHSYIPEEIELTIGLMRGSEMITLGIANLVITGEESEEMVIDLPINITKEAVEESKPTSKRSPSPFRKLVTQSNSSLKLLKAKAFSSDTKRRFRLSEESILRLHVKIDPQDKAASSYDTTEYSEESLFASFDESRSNNSDIYSPMDKLQYDFHGKMQIAPEPKKILSEIPSLTHQNVHHNLDKMDKTRISKVRGYHQDDSHGQYDERYNNHYYRDVYISNEKDDNGGLYQLNQKSYHHSTHGKRSSSVNKSSSISRSSRHNGSKHHNGSNTHYRSSSQSRSSSQNMSSSYSRSRSHKRSSYHNGASSHNRSSNHNRSSSRQKDCVPNAYNGFSVKKDVIPRYSTNSSPKHIPPLPNSFSSRDIKASYMVSQQQKYGMV